MGAWAVLLVVLGIAIVVILAAGVIYNRLVSLSVGVDSAWSNVDVQLNKRHDLIPNLVEMVKGYAAHERQTLEAVVRAGDQAVSTSDPSQRMQAQNMLTAALRQLFALPKAYPDLKANQNFLALQQQLSSVEQDIGRARSTYDFAVQNYNMQTRMFPDGLVATLFRFQSRPFFEIEEAERGTVRVQF